VQPAAEVHQSVCGLHFHAQLGHVAEDVAQLADDLDGATLQALHGHWRLGIDLHVGTVDAAPRLLQLLLHAHEIVAKLARAGELVL